jgi:hypothetical protein
MPEFYEMIDGGEGNVYHFLFYMLSNFLISKDISGDIVYYYPNKTNCPVSEGFLGLLPKNFVRHLVKDPSVKYTTFMHAIPCFKDYALPESYQLLRQLYKPHLSLTLTPGKKLYIQRKNTKDRMFINETDVQKSLEKLGYQTVSLEDYTIKEQIRMISESEHIVGAHGAGLALTVFCHPSAKVLEIYGAKNSERRHYYHIAHILKHRFMRFQDVLVSNTEFQHMIVNVAKLEEILQEWHHPRLF